MRKIPWKPIIMWTIGAELTGFLAGWISLEGTQLYAANAVKPPLSPPEWVFPVVWVLLYALMGIGAGLISSQPASQSKSRGLNLMVIQLVVNFFWPLLFFVAQAYGFSLLWLLLLWILVLMMILEYRKVLPLAAWLQIPYLIWLTFAVYLNAGVWYLNR